MYKHCLPEGYVLKQQQKAAEEDGEEKISLEDLIETERAKLMERPMDQLTRVTLETFMVWKRCKLAEKSKAVSDQARKKKNEYNQGVVSELSGRDLFQFNPELANSCKDDENDGEDIDYSRSDDEDKFAGFINEIDENAFTIIGDVNLFLDEDGQADAKIEDDLDSLKLS